MIDFFVSAAIDGERVDRAVALVTGWTRADVQELIAAGSVLVDGAAVTKSRRLATGEHVEALAEPTARKLPQPEPIPLDVRFEDADVIVLAKPAALVVHPSAGHPGGTLVNGLLARYPELATVGDPMRPGIVHRLDRDTSGLLVVARSQRSYDALVRALAAHEVERRYLALVWGAVEPARGAIDAPIGRSERRRTRMAVREGGKDAITRYEVRERLEGATLLECVLETGRTHQVRVHLAAIGHPVVGDIAYGGARAQVRLARPFLHAWELAFTHPVTGEELRRREPLPPELEVVLAELRDPGS